MQLSFPQHIRHAKDAVQFVCDKLSAQSVGNFIHTERDFVTVDVKGVSCSVEVDFVNHVVLFTPIGTGDVLWL